MLIGMFPKKQKNETTKNSVKKGIYWLYVLGTKPGVGNIVVNGVADALDQEQVNTNSSLIWSSDQCHEENKRGWWDRVTGSFREGIS